MSAHVLLNGKNDNMSLFRNELNKFNNTSTNVRFYLSYDIKTTLKSHFWRKTL